MKFRDVIYIWFVFLGFLAFEYYGLNFNESLSILKKLQAMGYIPANFNISKEPGRQLSLYLGWAGLGLMIIMNLYSLRKRVEWMSNLGKLQSWLNFHIMCGLLGPTFILFHCNFKVRGIVGISFWSMVVSFSSGLIGRYFFIQLLGVKKEYDDLAEKNEKKLEHILTKANLQTSFEDRELYLKRALVLVGAPVEGATLNAAKAFFISMAGDIRLWFREPEIRPGWPEVSRIFIKNYALNKRRSAFLVPFQRLMGYWHAFHFPFAIFMYVAAVIHVTAALVLGV